MPKGTLLISEPFLNDEYFGRSVVLLCEHDKKGAFGFVFNKTSEYSFSEVLPDIDRPDFPLYLGGPVEQNTLHFVHTLGAEIEGALAIGSNLYWGGNFEQIKSLMNGYQVQPEQIRFFIGYSGWSAGQLEREIETQKSWVLHEREEPSFLFKTPPENLWRTLLYKKGGEFKAWANYPIDPRLN